jgi:hypothetical protein
MNYAMMDDVVESILVRAYNEARMFGMIQVDTAIDLHSLGLDPEDVLAQAQQEQYNDE